MQCKVIGCSRNKKKSFQPCISSRKCHERFQLDHWVFLAEYYTKVYVLLLSRTKDNIQKSEPKLFWRLFFCVVYTFYWLYGKIGNYDCAQRFSTWLRCILSSCRRVPVENRKQLIIVTYSCAAQQKTDYSDLNISFQ